jgi:hypothetical protein
LKKKYKVYNDIDNFKAENIKKMIKLIWKESNDSNI